MNCTAPFLIDKPRPGRARHLDRLGNAAEGIEYLEKRDLGESGREMAIAVLKATASGQWIVNIYGVLSGRKRLAIQAHGSLGYVQRLSALYCDPASTPAEPPPLTGTSAGSHSRLAVAVNLEAEAANDEASGPRRPRP